jgi:hypothetical protein
VTYVAAAYGIVVATLAAYGLYLLRERSQLRRSLGEPGPESGRNGGAHLDEAGPSEI